MTCGCKHHFSGEEFFAEGQPYDTAALEIVQPPKFNAERVAPERPSHFKQIQDFNPQSSATTIAGVPSVFVVNTRVSSLGLGGVIPFNVRCFFTEMGGLSTLTPAALRTLATSLQAYPLSGFSPPPNVQIDRFWIMAPSEILDLGERLDGIEGFFFAPWSGVYPDVNSSAVNQLNAYKLATLQAQARANSVNADGYVDGSGNTFNGMQYNGSYDALHPTLGPIFAPVIRIGFARSKVVMMPHTKTPWVMPGVPIQASTGQGNLCIPAGSRFVTVTFTTPANTSALLNGVWTGQPVRLSSGNAAFDTTVEWFGYDGSRHQHPSDQLTAAARGQVSYTHDIEVFEIPRVAAAIGIFTTTSLGYALQYCATFSQD